MAFLRIAVQTGALVGLSVASLQGQARHAQVIIAPLGQPRIGTIAPPPPTTASQPVITYGPTIFASYPTVVAADGRIFVDLGNGYTEVAQTCRYAYGYTCESYGYPPAQVVPDYAVPNYIAPTSSAAARYSPPAHAAPAYRGPVYAGGYYRTEPTAGTNAYTTAGRSGDAAHATTRYSTPSRAVGPRVLPRRP
jgi:hypothetical protein